MPARTDGHSNRFSTVQQSSNIFIKEAFLQYIVIATHRSEYPDPITLSAGQPLHVGEKYEGPEGWDNWYFCTVFGQAGGWVPAQVIAFGADGSGRATEAYCARELDVDPGERLHGTRALNGWVWCERLASTEAGWVPTSHLQAMVEEAK